MYMSKKTMNSFSAFTHENTSNANRAKILSDLIWDHFVNVIELLNNAMYSVKTCPYIEYGTKLLSGLINYELDF
ncbi:unnamed protein product [Heterobilharzia americana]|nr:unnamed protein product [Heterobilharzia americana]CAH8600228.1 unnamed protein product [Heterobilharzia americana]